jgi:predicted short-subunit dehydrogenase-like oxidoreductase (DUF2520 family)
MVKIERSYTIIGDGRVAKHFSRYLSLLKISHFRWARSRNSKEDLAQYIADSSHILILILDSAIESFAKTIPDVSEKKLVHFSGSLVTSVAHGAHPLMTFTEELFSLEQYTKIPFVLDEGPLTFQELLPGLKNPHYYIKRQLRPLYHAFCVVSGNFTTVLWDRFFSSLEGQFGIPPEAAFPYLDQICRNLKNRSIPALTGPLARKDWETIEKNLEALQDDPMQKVYYGFLEALNLKIRENF